MILDGLFKRPKNELEHGGMAPVKLNASEGSEIARVCPHCGEASVPSELFDNLNVCKCGHHYRLNARQRIDYITDRDSFSELFSELKSHDILDFTGYEAKLKNSYLASKENEAVICGEAEIDGIRVGLFVMEPYFMLGSMGSVVGEKITRLFELAIQTGLPVLGFTVSGGARMQEGIISLMQMAKVSGAVKRHNDGGNLYMSVLTDPTTGGVTASFAMEGDIIIAEPDATIGFTGARVIEQTMRKKLPDGFQKSEFLLKHGFIDIIIERARQKEVISSLLKMHARREYNG